MNDSLDEILTSCAFCGGEATLAAAVDQGWIPSFFVSERGTGDQDTEIMKPVCPACAARHLHTDAEGLSVVYAESRHLLPR